MPSVGGLVGGFFLVHVAFEALHEFLEVDLVGVKFGAVHAGKADLVGYCHAAGSTHAHPVDHDGVEADDGFDFVGKVTSEVTFIMMGGPIA